MNTKLETDAIGLSALVLIFASWLVFALIFFLRKRPPKAEEAKRARAAKWGIVLQGVGFALVGTFRRLRWWLFPPSVTGEMALAVVAVLLAGVSNWWCLRSVQKLGKQWTVQARVIKGHELITNGPYGIVQSDLSRDVRAHVCDGAGFLYVVGAAHRRDRISDWQ